MAPDRSAEGSTDRMERAIAVTAWSVFRLSCIYSLLYKSKPLMQIPSMPLYQDTISNPGDKSDESARTDWRPYPYTQPSEPNQTRGGVQVFSDLWVISYKFSELETTESKKHNLPEDLTIGDNISVFAATAHIVCSHLLIEIHNAPLDSSAVPTDDPKKLSDFLEASKRMSADAELTMFQTMERFENKYGLQMLPEPMLVGPIVISKLVMESFTFSVTPDHSKDKTSISEALRNTTRGAQAPQIDGA
ncbi:hypothetical protein TWF694_001983 [Orbilia ellipsospora]|uniref:Uncharacterized protein n=1 Tax=Orbilia ellipsospora TaxID=2528407 RepID=A0AAV9X5M2_9PEZI